MERPPELRVPEAERLPQQKMRIPRLRRPPAQPTGPKWVGVNVQKQVVGGPGAPPPGFISPANSKTEWMVYWALAKIFGNPIDPRLPPFEGGRPDWTYQAAYNGGAGTLGGTTIDFIVESGRQPTAFRIVTEYYHIFTDRRKQVGDELQKIAIADRYQVIDLYDQDFINDLTGQAAIQVIKMGLAMIERPDPILVGTSLRGSRMDILAG